MSIMSVSTHLQYTFAIYICNVHLPYTLAMYICNIHLQCASAIYICNVHCHAWQSDVATGKDSQNSAPQWFSIVNSVASWFLRISTLLSKVVTEKNSRKSAHYWIYCIIWSNIRLWEISPASAFRVCLHFKNSQKPAYWKGGMYNGHFWKDNAPH